MKLARGLIAVASVCHAGAYVFAQSEHVVDASWPPHARFHTLQALIWIVALDLVLAALAVWLADITPRAARWAFGLGGLAAHGAYFASLAALPAGSPPEGWGAHAPLAGVAVVYLVGLALVLRRGVRPA